jgi:hypothetical protein
VVWAVTLPPADLRSLSLYYYAVCGRVCMSSVCVWCSCLLVIRGGHPEDGREKRTSNCNFLSYATTAFS